MKYRDKWSRDCTHSKTLHLAEDCGHRSIPGAKPYAYMKCLNSRRCWALATSFPSYPYVMPEAVFSASLPSLPIVDITPYLSSSSSSTKRAVVAQSLHLACRDVGFFYLRTDSLLSTKECTEILKVGHEFFECPQSEKDRIGLESSDLCRGVSYSAGRFSMLMRNKAIRHYVGM